MVHIDMIKNRNITASKVIEHQTTTCTLYTNCTHIIWVEQRAELHDLVHVDDAHGRREPVRARHLVAELVHSGGALSQAQTAARVQTHVLDSIQYMFQ